MILSIQRPIGQRIHHIKPKADTDEKYDVHNDRQTRTSPSLKSIASIVIECRGLTKAVECTELGVSFATKRFSFRSLRLFALKQLRFSG